MLNLEREGKNKENANFVHIVCLLVELCNIFDEAFFIDVSLPRYRSLTSERTLSYASMHAFTSGGSRIRLSAGWYPWKTLPCGGE